MIPIPLVAAGISALGGIAASGISAGSASANREFQERMSGTSYQRAVRDMRAAGLNPMLAYNMGGASTPGGATFTGEDVLTPALSSAIQAGRAREELKNLRETNELIRAQTNDAVAGASAKYASAELAASQGALNEQTQRESVAREAAARQGALESAARTRLTETERQLLSASLATARNVEAVEKTMVGKSAAYIERIRRALIGGGSLIPK